MAWTSLGRSGDAEVLAECVDGVAPAGHYAHVLSEGLRVLPIATPPEIHEAGHLRLSGGEISLSGSLPWVGAESDVRVVSVADPTRPLLLRSHQVGDSGSATKLQKP